MKGQVWEMLDKGILHRQIFKDLKSQPQISLVELFVSDNCPLTCKHCFHADVRTIDPPLSLREWQSVIEEFISLGVRHFHIAGREPFTELITLELLEFLSEKKKTVDLTFGAISNGLNSRKHLAKIQASRLDYLEISVDGLTDTHDFIRGKGTYRHVIKTLKEALALLGDNRVSTATSLHKANVDQVPGIIHELAQLGIRRLFFQPVLPMGYALNMTDLLMGGEEYRRAILATKELLAQSEYEYQKHGIAVMFYVPPELIHSLCRGDAWFEKELGNYIREGKSVTKQGSSYLQLEFNVIRVPFWRHFIVTEDGYVIDECASRSIPDYIKRSAGSVRQLPLRDLIHNSRQFAMDYVDMSLAASVNNNQLSCASFSPLRSNVYSCCNNVQAKEVCP